MGMETFYRKPPIALPDRAEVESPQAQSRLDNICHVSGRRKKKQNPPSRVDFWLHTRRADNATRLGPGSPEALPQSTRHVSTAATAQASPPPPAAPLQLGAGLAVLARRGGPPLPSPSLWSPFSSMPRSSLASRAPRGPPGRPRMRPGWAAPGPERRLQRGRGAGVVLPPGIRSPSTARPGASPPRQGCGWSAAGAGAAPAQPPRDPARRRSAAVPATAAGRDRGGGARGGAWRRGRGPRRGDAHGDEHARSFRRASPSRGTAIGQQRARAPARAGAGRRREGAPRRGPCCDTASPSASSCVAPDWWTDSQ